MSTTSLLRYEKYIESNDLCELLHAQYFILYLVKKHVMKDVRLVWLICQARSIFNKMVRVCSKKKDGM